MQPKVMSPHPAPNFHASHWQNRDPSQSTWHALETAFGQGQSFLNTLDAWQQSPDSPQQLFFTAFSAEAPQNLPPALATACVGLLPGVHRFVFEQGRVQLTLCIGAAPQIAKEIDIASNSIVIDNLDPWGVKTLARLCKTGTCLQWLNASSSCVAELKSAGFQIDSTKHSACYEPPWQIKSSLRQSPEVLHPHFISNSNNAIVIGAGLGGSAVAHSLASRGWKVLVLDQGDALGAGASGLPAGIFTSHVSPDNNVLSRITRDGVRATVVRAQSLLERGRDFDISSLLEHRYAGKRELPKGELWPRAGHEWSTHACIEQKLAAGLKEVTAALWHNMAGWLQPQTLVKAQLRHANIEVQTRQKVAQLVTHNHQWQCRDAHGALMAQAPLLILANAYDAQALIDGIHLSSPDLPRPHLPATALRGQVTLGSMSMLPQNLQSQLPHFPVNGHGSFIGHLQNPEKLNEAFWIVGSSFQRNDFDLQTRKADQISNLEQWAELMPAWQDQILKHIDLEQTTSWAAVRMALPDRLPAVGAFSHQELKGLMVCTGLGARGISWSVLCGELLAAHANHEPLPMAASLAKLMAASRFG
jgi:tRNA 5-methylaminomethyl-2-thiouridine biosynthesis bifunctional protein